MSPFAFIFAITVIGRFAAAYPHPASGAIKLPSPTNNSSIQPTSASATPTPGESPPPKTEEVPDQSKNALPVASPNPSPIGFGAIIQAINLNVESVPQNNSIKICAQGSGNELVSTTAIVYVYWLLFCSAALLGLKVIHNFLHICSDWKSRRSPEDRSEEDPEKKPVGLQLEKLEP